MLTQTVMVSVFYPGDPFDPLIVLVLQSTHGLPCGCVLLVVCSGIGATCADVFQKVAVSPAIMAVRWTGAAIFFFFPSSWCKWYTTCGELCNFCKCFNKSLLGTPKLFCESCVGFSEPCSCCSVGGRCGCKVCNCFDRFGFVV